MIYHVCRMDDAEYGVEARTVRLSSSFSWFCHGALPDVDDHAYSRRQYCRQIREDIAELVHSQYNQLITPATFIVQIGDATFDIEWACAFLNIPLPGTVE